MLCTTATNTSNTIRTQTGAAERESSGLDTKSCYCASLRSVCVHYRPITVYSECVLVQPCVPYYDWMSLIYAVDFLCHPRKFPQYGRTLHDLFAILRA